MAQATSGQRTAVIVTFGDSVSVLPRCLGALAAYTPADAEIILCLPPVPDFVSGAVREIAAQRPLTVVPVPAGASANRQRNLGVARSGKRDAYVFVDHDTLVVPGWLESLRDAAQREGADLASPLLLQGEPELGIVHMAGGRVIFRPDADGRRGMDEIHDFACRPVAEALAFLGTAPIATDLEEFHCLLIGPRGMAAIGRFDEGLENCMEHVDVSLSVAAAGGKMILCPDTVVTYLGPDQYTVCDAAWHQRAWADERSRKTLRHFAAKHGLAPDGEFFARQFGWNVAYRESVGVAQPGHVPPPPLTDLARHPYPRTWPELVRCVLAQGWREADLGALKACYELALVNFAGLCRASYRPSVDHMVGVAGVLALHGAPPVMVKAGLLHSLLMDSALAPPSGETADPRLLEWLGWRAGPQVRDIVCLYAALRWEALPPPGDAEAVARYPLDRACCLAIRAANDIDEHLDHGFGLSAKAPAAPDAEAVRVHAEAVLPALGYATLARDLEAAHRLRADPSAVPPVLNSGRTGTFRIDDLDEARWSPPASPVPPTPARGGPVSASSEAAASSAPAAPASQRPPRRGWFARLFAENATRH